MILLMAFLKPMFPHLEVEIPDKLLGDKQDPLAEDSVHIMLTLDPEPKHYSAGQTLMELVCWRFVQNI